LTLHSLYLAGLARYRRREHDRKSFFNQAFTAGISWMVRFLSRRRGMTYPARAIGGWYWVDRLRFELLMEWFEFDEVESCKKIIRPGMTVLDIGAHIGYYSLLFSRLVGPTGRVIAFEINPENFETARENVRARGCRNVEVFPFGVCDRSGPRTLHISPGNSNHSLMAGYTVAERTLEVACVSLDDFLAERKIARVDFIKSDTEGAELLVVEGARRTLENAGHMDMLMEYNPKAMECGEVAAPELLRTLTGMGFACKAILAGGTLGDIPELAGNESVNLLCRKSS
jgi:FkbM family methyltransferase